MPPRLESTDAAGHRSRTLQQATVVLVSLASVLVVESHLDPATATLFAGAAVVASAVARIAGRAG